MARGATEARVSVMATSAAMAEAGAGAVAAEGSKAEADGAGVEAVAVKGDVGVSAVAAGAAVTVAADGTAETPALASVAAGEMGGAGAASITATVVVNRASAAERRFIHAESARVRAASGIYKSVDGARDWNLLIGISFLWWQARFFRPGKDADTRGDWLILLRGFSPMNRCGPHPCLSSVSVDQPSSAVGIRLQRHLHPAQQFLARKGLGQIILMLVRI